MTGAERGHTERLDLIRRVCIKAAYQAERVRSSQAMGTKAGLVREEGGLHGMAIIVADVLHITQAPAGFELGVLTALNQVGRLSVPSACSRERAAEIRGEWEHRMYVATCAEIGVTLTPEEQAWTTSTT